MSVLLSAYCHIYAIRSTIQCAQDTIGNPDGVSFHSVRISRFPSGTEHKTIRSTCRMLPSIVLKMLRGKTEVHPSIIS